MTSQSERDVATEAAAHLADDSHLGPVEDAHGTLSLDPSDDLFERLVTSILRQQVSGAAARAIEERLFDAVEVTPQGIAAASEETLREAGLSRQKAGYVDNVARAFIENGHSKDRLSEHSNEEIVETLTAIPGIGPWTAEMQLMFCFGRPDVFPVGVLGIRKGMERLFGEEMTRAEMVERAARWQPYRSYASLYLWRTVD